MDIGALGQNRLVSNSQFWYFLAVWPWTSDFMIWGPHLVIQKMEMMALPHKAALSKDDECR